jgi:hypothetical protein
MTLLKTPSATVAPFVSRQEGVTDAVQYAGAAVIDALHETRSRQAARELEYYRHLIDEAGSDATRARSGNPIADRKPKPSASRSPRRTAVTMLIIAVLAVLASLYITGGIRIAARFVSSMSEPTMLVGD